MRKTIEHPEFGKLSYLLGWEGSVVLKGWGRGHWPDKIGLGLAGDESGPDPDAVLLARALVERRSQLADIIVNGLWAELEGREPECREYWAGNLDVVNEALRHDHERPLERAEDLLRVLEPLDLFVRTEQWDRDLVAGITFRAAFEEEHGVEVLTDGEKVLGTGYICHAVRYQRFSKTTPQEKEARGEAARKWIEQMNERSNRMNERWKQS